MDIEVGISGFCGNNSNQNETKSESESEDSDEVCESVSFPRNVPTKLVHDETAIDNLDDGINSLELNEASAENVIDVKFGGPVDEKKCSTDTSDCYSDIRSYATSTASTIAPNVIHARLKKGLNKRGKVDARRRCVAKGEASAVIRKRKENINTIKECTSASSMWA